MKKILDAIFKYSSGAMLVVVMAILFRGCDIDSGQQRRGVILLLGYTVIAIFWFLFVKQKPKTK